MRPFTNDNETLDKIIIKKRLKHNPTRTNNISKQKFQQKRVFVHYRGNNNQSYAIVVKQIVWYTNHFHNEIFKDLLYYPETIFR